MKMKNWIQKALHSSHSIKSRLALTIGVLLYTISSPSLSYTINVEDNATSVSDLINGASYAKRGETSLEGELAVDFGGPNQLNDEDLFSFYIDTGSTFLANIAAGNPIGAPRIPLITLFEWVDGSLYRRASNDPVLRTTFLSYTNTTVNQHGASAYYLLVSQFENAPINNHGEALYQNDLANNAWAGMEGKGSSSWIYSIATSGISSSLFLDNLNSINIDAPFINLETGEVLAPTVVPVPSAIWLFCVGLLGLMRVARGKF